MFSEQTLMSMEISSSTGNQKLMNFLHTIGYQEAFDAGKIRTYADKIKNNFRRCSIYH